MRLPSTRLLQLSQKNNNQILLRQARFGVIVSASTKEIDMKDYSKMSDFEINKAVAINRGGYQGHVEHMEHGVKESDRDSHGIFYL